MCMRCQMDSDVEWMNVKEKQTLSDRERERGGGSGKAIHVRDRKWKKNASNASVNNNNKININCSAEIGWQFSSALLFLHISIPLYRYRWMYTMYSSLAMSPCVICAHTCISLSHRIRIFNIFRASFLIWLCAKWRWTESMESKNE